jgi:hypothetical protein
MRRDKLSNAATPLVLRLKVTVAGETFSDVSSRISASYFGILPLTENPAIASALKYEELTHGDERNFSSISGRK